MTQDINDLIARLEKGAAPLDDPDLNDESAALLREQRDEIARLLADPMNVGWQRAQDAIKDRAAAVSQWKAAKQRAERAEAERDNLQCVVNERIAIAHKAEAEREAAIKDAERYRWLLEWLTAVGLLHFEQHCTRPDRTHGEAWILRKPYSIDGGSLVGWSATRATDAIDAAMKEKS